MAYRPVDRRGRLFPTHLSRLNRPVPWLLLAIGTAALVYVAYLSTHPYPAYAGGLYLVIARQIVHNGYVLPAFIPHYTSGGIPFAYPPLMFYVTALAMDVGGFDPLALSRLLPGLFVLAYLVPFYGIASELLDSTEQAGLATVLLGVTPTVLRWHLSSGGLVRAPAFLLALACTFTGVKLFKTGDRRWALPSVVLFGLMVLTHPTYSMFVVLTYLLLFVTFDRTLGGLAAGAVVGFGGFAIAAPWLVEVIGTHGADIYLTAAGTHGGLGGGFRRLVVQLTYPLDNFDVEWPFYVAAYVGGAYLLWNRRLFLPAWLAASAYVIGKNRFVFVAGSMLTAVFVFERLVPRVQGWVPTDGYRSWRRRAVPAAVTLVVIVGAVTAGVAYGAGVSEAAHEHSASQPQYMDQWDRDAMTWMDGHTDASAEFVVIGDAAEWVPTFTDRTILLGPWGVEWVGTETYYDEVELYKDISACTVASCLTDHLATADRDPAYIYVPKGHYTVRGKEYEQSPWMRQSLVESERYEIVYENEGVIIARVTGTERYAP